MDAITIKRLHDLEHLRELYENLFNDLTRLYNLIVDADLDVMTISSQSLIFINSLRSVLELPTQGTAFKETILQYLADQVNRIDKQIAEL